MQGIWALLTNAHLSGFVTGRIYSGPLKRFCVPGMNCYACPGALGACPIGALQAMATGRKPRFAFYVLGWLALLGLAAYTALFVLAAVRLRRRRLARPGL